MTLPGYTCMHDCVELTADHYPNHSPMATTFCTTQYQLATYMCNGTSFLNTAAATTILLILLSLYALWFLSLSRSLSGPRVWPLVGSLPSLVFNRRRVHDWIASNLRSTRTHTYQTCLVALPFYARNRGLYTVTCHPRNLEHILRARFDNYPKGPIMREAFGDLLGKGIFNSDGGEWLVQRKTAALEFTTRTLRSAMERWTNGFVRNRLWVILGKAEKEGRSVDVMDLLLRLTFDGICGLTFGVDPGTLAPDLPDNPFAAAFDAATEATLQRFLYPGLLWRLKKVLQIGAERRLRKSIVVVARYIVDAIAARAANGEHNSSDDLLSRFMHKKDAQGRAFSPTVLQGIAVNFVLAGRDTSSIALTWFFYQLTRHPEIDHKLIVEMTSVLKSTRGACTGSITEPLSFEELDRLVYLKACLAETLRLYPPVPEDTKFALADDVLPDGTRVPAGSTVTYSIYSVARMPAVWGDDCLQFKPERWMSADGTRFEVPRDPYQFVVFNAGPRTCLGKDLAYLQMKSIAAAVLLRHRLQVVPGHKVEQKMSLTLFMRNGLRVNVLPRNLNEYC